MGRLSADIQRARDSGILEQEAGQLEVDELWARWCDLAAQELTEATGEELEGMGRSMCTNGRT